MGHDGQLKGTKLGRRKQARFFNFYRLGVDWEEWRGGWRLQVITHSVTHSTRASINRIPIAYRLLPFFVAEIEQSGRGELKKGRLGFICIFWSFPLVPYLSPVLCIRYNRFIGFTDHLISSNGTVAVFCFFSLGRGLSLSMVDGCCCVRQFLDKPLRFEKCEKRHSIRMQSSQIGYVFVEREWLAAVHSHGTRIFVIENHLDRVRWESDSAPFHGLTRSQGTSQ